MAGISDKAVKTNYAENKYRYNGKELQHQEFSDGSGLEEYDFDTRLQDPQLGVWHNIDPHADNSRKWSPYTYAYNDPIKFTDPDGMDNVVQTPGGSSYTSSLADWNDQRQDEIQQRANRLGSNSAFEQSIADEQNERQKQSDAAPVDQGEGGSDDQDQPPAQLKNFIAIAAGEAAGNSEAAKAIASTLINRIDAANSSLYDPNWLKKSIHIKGLGGTVKGNYQILKHPKQYEYRKVMKMTLDQIMKSDLPYVKAALQAYNDWGKVDYSKGAISWSATPKTEQARANDNNFKSVDAGVYIITTVAGNSTFFGFKN